MLFSSLSAQFGQLAKEYHQNTIMIGFPRDSETWAIIQFSFTPRLLNNTFPLQKFQVELYEAILEPESRLSSSY